MRGRDPLEPVLEDVREELEAQIGGGGRVRDFAAMIARARALDPDAVSEDDAAEAVGYAKVVALRRPITASSPAVDPSEGAAARRRGGASRARWAGAAAAILLGLGLVGAATLARREVATETGGAASHLSPTPGAETVRVEGPEGGAPTRARGGAGMSKETGPKEQVVEDMSEGAGSLPAEGGDPVGSAATAGDGALSGDGAFSGDGALSGDGARSAGDGALAGDGAVSGDGALSGDGAHPGAGGAESRSAAPAATAGVGAGGSSSNGAAGAPGARPRLARGELARASAAAELAEASWEALDLAARAAWRRGDLDEARALLGIIVASAGDRERVELAYGDLLILARQAGDAAALQRARRDYLRRFPRGTYAEDASAGLCRDDDDRGCWRAYLERWPAGAHADEARRGLGE
ncbi:MAG: hypothetical protein R3B09_24385 [Nannocystaceae bacterium]